MNFFLRMKILPLGTYDRGQCAPNAPQQDLNWTQKGSPDVHGHYAAQSIHLCPSFVRFPSQFRTSFDYGCMPLPFCYQTNLQADWFKFVGWFDTYDRINKPRKQNQETQQTFPL